MEHKGQENHISCRDLTILYDFTNFTDDTPRDIPYLGYFHTTSKDLHLSREAVPNTHPSAVSLAKTIGMGNFGRQLLCNPKPSLGVST